ncbi:MAG: hypothetical protein ACI8QI_000659 [Limisphaerales bacterium]|jgi:hypothetical protein
MQQRRLVRDYEKTEASAQALGLYHDDIPSDAQIGLSTVCFRFFKQALRHIKPNATKNVMNHIKLIAIKAINQ